MSILKTLLPMSDIVEITSEIIKQNRAEREEARSDKKQYLDKLENASGEEVFKLMNLISFANMDEFVAEARLHAQQSFRICLLSAAVGFFLICVSIGFAIYFQIAGIEGLSAAYLGSTVGLITEAISAIFFTLYSRTTTQVNRLYDRLLGSQSAYSAILTTTLLPDDVIRQEQIVALANKMIARLEGLDKSA